jgi:hypothetical protein
MFRRARNTSTQESAFEIALRRHFGDRHPKAIASDLARDLYFAAGIHKPPFDPFLYARHLSLPVEYREIGSDGVLASWPESPRIVLRTSSPVSSNLERRRRAFTLAHELGHFVVRRELLAGGIKIPSNISDRADERLADRFASELLMPHHHLVPELQARGISPEACLGICEKFGVSLTSLLHRIGDFALPGRHFFAALWTWSSERERFVVSWATPMRYKELVLTSHGSSSIERTFGTGAPCWADDSFSLDGKLLRWKCMSLRLQFRETVLTVGRRPSCPYELHHRVPALNPDPKTKVEQLGFDFPESRRPHRGGAWRSRLKYE